MTLSSDTHARDRAAVETPIIHNSSTPLRCLTFYYFMNGANVGDLSVIPRHGVDLGGAVWTQGRPQGDLWIAGHVDIAADAPFSVVLEAEKGNNEEGIIALDELLLHGASCSVVGPTDAPDTKMMCDFEEDLCGFKLEDEHGKWIWTYPHSPDNDFPHPLKYFTFCPLNTGHYLAAPLEDDREGEVGRVVSPEYSLERHEGQCLVFWYIHNGNTDRDVLEVYVKHGLSIFPQAAWREKANHMYTWMRANIAIPSGRNHFSVIWRAVQKKRDNKGVFALDDVEILEEECPNIGTCTFQWGTCGWQNLYQTENTTDETDWIQSSGDDGLNGITPPDDHTGDSKGKFLYVDGTNGTTGTAVLESQLLTPEQHSDFCFSFWFFIDGVPADEISINSVVSDGTEKVLWSYDGASQGWTKGQVRVNAAIFIFDELPYQSGLPFHLHRGRRTTSASILAMDDFSFKRELECHTLPPLSPPTTPATPSLWACTFAQKTYWINHSRLLALNRRQPALITAQVGPPAFGRASCYSSTLVLKADPGKGSRGALPSLAAVEGPRCLTFWYQIDGADAGELSVVVTLSGGKEEGLWTRGWPQVAWALASVDIPVDGSSKVEIVGLMGDNTEGNHSD
ncbi:MAM and LDL-receptor class A domain-containing protein 1-like [Penaeus monodon]|uniref:MAM and LDL-receptor class A domain-containing protein 1-like n=1 Tax=Penaeus monodon TaxID=6687 RepID=UPI0018A6E2AD|nr:MAM and LDL-receptor class A domain-containing protein 1-like [Penaeus monodon]